MECTVKKQHVAGYCRAVGAGLFLILRARVVHQLSSLLLATFIGIKRKSRSQNNFEDVKLPMN